MRNLLLISGVALVVVISVTWYTASFIREFEDQKAEVEKQLVEAQDALRATNKRWPYRAKNTRLEAKRFEHYLQVRKAIDETLKARYAQPDARRGFNAKRGRNFALEIMSKSLVSLEMSVDEYVAIRDRFAAILSGGDPTDLLTQWRVQTSNAAELQKGLPLPAAATDVTDEERKLIEKHKKRLIEALGAELLEPWYRPATTGYQPPAPNPG